jgi:hypothetical protein
MVLVIKGDGPRDYQPCRWDLRTGESSRATRKFPPSNLSSHLESPLAKTLPSSQPTTCNSRATLDLCVNNETITW